MEVFSFENGVPKNITGNGEISVSNKHYKDGRNSLEWRTKTGGSLKISTSVGYVPFDPSAKSKARCTFIFWVYQEKALTSKMQITFGKENIVDCYFDMQMNFTGWRTVWVPFEQMCGTPAEDMTQITFNLSTSDEHVLYFDQIIPMHHVDSRHHTRDTQVPFVNLRADTAANSHWMSIFRFNSLYEENTKDIENLKLTKKQISEIEIVAKRYKEILLSDSPYPTGDKTCLWWDDIGQAQKFYEMFGIQKNAEIITGKTIAFTNQDVIYPKEHKAELKYLSSTIDITLCSDFLLDIAYMWHCAQEVQKPLIEEMYLNTVLYLIDQGWDFGSGLGTVHHLGYATRGFYSSVFLMCEVLRKNALLQKVQKIACWFSGVGRMFRADEEFIGESCDVFNTLLLPIVATILIDEDEKRKHISLKALKHWLDKSLEPAPGIEGGVKVDGAMFHHANHYPAYAMGGFKGIALVVYMLSKTEHAIDSFSHNMLRKAVLAMRIYSNSLSWPVSLSARHPVGDGDRGQISTFDHFYYMALAGNPENDAKFDDEMVSALLRLMKFKPFSKGKTLAHEGYMAENAPNGHFSMNYACSAFHRRGEWLASVRGHSKYIWGNETYLANNLYGRYIAYGNLQILSKGEPINHRESGYVQNGWDWNFWPGTTAVELPMDKLRADVCNVDDLSGFEEMLISDKAFAGGVNIGGENGVFALDLHSHAKYDASHVAKKSYFFFGEKIICIGSDISNENALGKTYTTVFQNYLINTDDAVYVDESEITNADFENVVENCNMLYDNCNNGHYLPRGQKVLLSKKMQHSCDQNTGKATCENFAKAAIVHGEKPQNASYEYCTFVDISLEKMRENVKQIEKGTVYKTLCANNNLHCVFDVESKTTGYVLWEKSQNLNFGFLRSVSSPVLVMEKATENGFDFSVADPDLRLYDGVEPDQVDENGLQKEVSLYSRKWQANSSKAKEICLEFGGVFNVSAKDNLFEFSCKHVENKTFVSFMVSDGLSYEFHCTLS